jgi:hypothetical protein
MVPTATTTCKGYLNVVNNQLIFINFFLDFPFLTT